MKIKFLISLILLFFILMPISYAKEKIDFDGLIVHDDVTSGLRQYTIPTLNQDGYIIIFNTNSKQTFKGIYFDEKLAPMQIKNGLFIISGKTFFGIEKSNGQRAVVLRIEASKPGDDYTCKENATVLTKLLEFQVYPTGNPSDEIIQYNGLLLCENGTKKSFIIKDSTGKTVASADVKVVGSGPSVSIKQLSLADGAIRIDYSLYLADSYYGQTLFSLELSPAFIDSLLAQLSGKEPVKPVDLSPTDDCFEIEEGGMCFFGPSDETVGKCKNYLCEPVECVVDSDCGQNKKCNEEGECVAKEYVRLEIEMVLGKLGEREIAASNALLLAKKTKALFCNGYPDAETGLPAYEKYGFGKILWDWDAKDISTDTCNNKVCDASQFAWSVIDRMSDNRSIGDIGYEDLPAQVDYLFANFCAEEECTIKASDLLPLTKETVGVKGYFSATKVYKEAFFVKENGELLEKRNTCNDSKKKKIEGLKKQIIARIKADVYKSDNEIDTLGQSVHDIEFQECLPKVLNLMNPGPVLIVIDKKIEDSKYTKYDTPNILIEDLIEGGIWSKLPNGDFVMSFDNLYDMFKQLNEVYKNQKSKDEKTACVNYVVAYSKHLKFEVKIPDLIMESDADELAPEEQKEQNLRNALTAEERSFSAVGVGEDETVTCVSLEAEQKEFIELWNDFFETFRKHASIVIAQGASYELKVGQKNHLGKDAFFEHSIYKGMTEEDKEYVGLFAADREFEINPDSASEHISVFDLYWTPLLMESNFSKDFKNDFQASYEKELKEYNEDFIQYNFTTVGSNKAGKHNAKMDFDITLRWNSSQTEYDISSDLLAAAKIDVTLKFVKSIEELVGAKNHLLEMPFNGGIKTNKVAGDKEVEDTRDGYGLTVENEPIEGAMFLNPFVELSEDYTPAETESTSGKKVTLESHLVNDGTIYHIDDDSIIFNSVLPTVITIDSNSKQNIALSFTTVNDVLYSGVTTKLDLITPSGKLITKYTFAGDSKNSFYKDKFADYKCEFWDAAAFKILNAEKGRYTGITYVQTTLESYSEDIVRRLQIRCTKEPITLTSQSWGSLKPQIAISDNPSGGVVGLITPGAKPVPNDLMSYLGYIKEGLVCVAPAESNKVLGDDRIALVWNAQKLIEKIQQGKTAAAAEDETLIYGTAGGAADVVSVEKKGEECVSNTDCVNSKFGKFCIGEHYVKKEASTGEIIGKDVKDFVKGNCGKESVIGGPCSSVNDCKDSVKVKGKQVSLICANVHYSSINKDGSELSGFVHGTCEGGFGGLGKGFVCWSDDDCGYSYSTLVAEDYICLGEHWENGAKFSGICGTHLSNGISCYSGYDCLGGICASEGTGWDNKTGSAKKGKCESSNYE